MQDLIYNTKSLEDHFNSDMFRWQQCSAFGVNFVPDDGGTYATETCRS
jgi:hypothetical protein